MRQKSKMFSQKRLYTALITPLYEPRFMLLKIRLGIILGQYTPLYFFRILINVLLFNYIILRNLA